MGSGRDQSRAFGERAGGRVRRGGLGRDWSRASSDRDHGRDHGERDVGRARSCLTTLGDSDQLWGELRGGGWPSGPQGSGEFEQLSSGAKRQRSEQFGGSFGQRDFVFGCEHLCGARIGRSSNCEGHHDSRSLHVAWRQWFEELQALGVGLPLTQAFRAGTPPHLRGHPPDRSFDDWMASAIRSEEDMRTDTELDGEAEEAMLRAAQQFDNEESDMLFQAENDNLSTESLWCEADREDLFPFGLSCIPRGCSAAVL